MPGSIRALRRRADPVRGGGRIPLVKKRTAGRPQFRTAGTDTLSAQEERIADTVEAAFTSVPQQTLLDSLERRDEAGYALAVLNALSNAQGRLQDALLASFVSSGETSAVDLGRELSRQYRQVGKADTPSPSEVALRFRFNATDPRATAWAQNEAGRLITNMAASEREMFRALVEQSFVESRTMGTTASSIFQQLQTVTPTPSARDFGQSIGANLNGLTTRYERAVMNRVASVADDLAARGITGEKALERMRKEGDKYATKLRRTRSRTIARTERMMAHNQARLLSYQQAIDSGLMSREYSRKVWSTGPFDVCPICVAMSGVEAKVADPFTLPNGAQVQAPPGHPNCRCTLQTRTDTMLYDPPRALGTGEPGDPFRIGGRGLRDLDSRPRIFSPDVDQIVTPGVPAAAPAGPDVPPPSGSLTVDLDDLRPRARVITAADDFDDLIETEPVILTGKDGKQIDMGIRQPIRRAPQKWYDRYTSGQYGEYQKLGHYDVTAVPAAADSLDAILEAGRRAGQLLDEELQRRLPRLLDDATNKKALLNEAEQALAERWSLQYDAIHSGYRATLREAAETAPARYATILRKQADSDDLMIGYQTRPEPSKEKSILNALRKVEDDNPIIERLLRNRYDVADGIDLDEALRAQGMTRREAFDKVFGENGSDDLAQALERLVENHPVTIEMRSEYDDVWRAVQEARIASGTAQEAVDGARADIIEEIMGSSREGFGTGSIRSRIRRADTREGDVKVDDVMTVVDTVSRRVPVEWVERIEPHEIKWVQRGHYEFESKIVNISGHANDQGLRYFSQRTWQSTLHHELTHAFQFSNPTIPRAERLFMARRAQERAAQIGDDFWELRPIYKDNPGEQRLLLDLQPGDAYIDKAYGGFNTPGSGANPTELSTKATELLFNGGDISPEVREFILGLLLLG